MREEQIMKRQDSLLSSSSRRQMPPENRRAPPSSTVGCMSGVFHFVCKYQTRRRKFLITFGRKKDERAISSPGEDKSSNETQAATSMSADCQPENAPAAPPSLVARLMGVEGFPKSTAAAPETAAEKRRKLLGALEKCDEDLRALKKVIEALRTVEPNPRTPSPPLPLKNNAIDINSEESVNCGGEKVRLSSDQQPSPVSVLDAFARSPPSDGGASKKDMIGRATVQQIRRKPGEEDHINPTYFLNKSIAEEPWEEDVASPYWSSKAMRESVEEVCRDISWGEKREIGRIGMALHEGICRDLIEEIVKELGCYYDVYCLPFEACKRRLCF